MLVALTKNPADLFDIQPDLLPARRDYAASRIRDGMSYLATIDGQNAGFLNYVIWWGNTPFIELLKVKPAFQRRGVGTALLQAAIQDLKQRGFTQLISSTEVINPLGLSFHHRLNFIKLNSLSLLHGEEQFYKIFL